MGLRKCPRCELNYIRDNEKICSICRRDVHGEPEQYDTIELCSECGEHPAIPGGELCIYCFKELSRRSPDTEPDDAIPVPTEDPTLEIDTVSSMDEITLDLPDVMEDDIFDEEDKRVFAAEQAKDDPEDDELKSEEEPLDAYIDEELNDEDDDDSEE